MPRKYSIPPVLNRAKLSFTLSLSVFLLLLITSCEKDEKTVQFKLTTVVSPVEGGTISTTGGTFDSGKEVTLTATPSQGYVFKNWSGAITGNENPIKVVFNADKNISANFEKMDSDADGVPDDIDQCNETVAGQTVDAQGCSESQNDADGDGVPNGVDTCADTPSGETVDETGCSDSQKDTDNDGVIDTADTCEDTPEGETVDENGCSDSQIDTDGDGITDNLDQCAETPEGETVDENGCSDSQKDTDGDGVTDDIDQCPETEEGETVDEEGCKLVAQTFVPDDHFEQQLIDLGYDDVLDDYVNTENIISVEILALNGLNQDGTDLTGIEDFVALTSLFISSMTTSLVDLSNHPLLETVTIGFSEVEQLLADSHENLEKITNNGSRIVNAVITNCPKLMEMPSRDSYYDNLELTDNPLIVELGGVDDNAWGDVRVEDCDLFEGFVTTSGVRSLEFINCDSVTSININYIESLIGFPIGGIVLSGNQNLTEVDVRNANLSSLIITDGNAITNINLEGNILNSIDISTLANLENLTVLEDNLSCIQVTQSQLDNIPATWSVNGATYSLDCAQ